LLTASSCAVILLIINVLNSCSYTQFAKSQERPNRYHQLADLVVKQVKTSLRRVLYADAPDEQLAVTFNVRVQNIGHAPFEGTLFIGWIDRPEHFQSSQVDHVGPYKPCTLTPGDSIDLSESWSYPLRQSTTPVKLILLTDSRSISQNDAPTYHCGAFPVQEERYDNNQWSVIVQPDSIDRE